jgi:hypothetical protein
VDRFAEDAARRFMRLQPTDPLKALDVYASEINWPYVAEKLNRMT